MAEVSSRLRRWNAEEQDGWGDEGDKPRKYIAFLFPSHLYQIARNSMISNRGKRSPNEGHVVRSMAIANLWILAGEVGRGFTRLLEYSDNRSGAQLKNAHGEHNLRKYQLGGCVVRLCLDL